MQRVKSLVIYNIERDYVIEFSELMVSVFQQFIPSEKSTDIFSKDTMPTPSRVPPYTCRLPMNKKSMENTHRWSASRARSGRSRRWYGRGWSRAAAPWPGRGTAGSPSASRKCPPALRRGSHWLAPPGPIQAESSRRPLCSPCVLWIDTDSRSLYVLLEREFST